MLVTSTLRTSFQQASGLGKIDDGFIESKLCIKYSIHVGEQVVKRLAADLSIKSHGFAAHPVGCWYPRISADHITLDPMNQLLEHSSSNWGHFRDDAPSLVHPDDAA